MARPCFTVWGPTENQPQEHWVDHHSAPTQTTQPCQQAPRRPSVTEHPVRSATTRAGSVQVDRKGINWRHYRKSWGVHLCEKKGALCLLWQSDTEGKGFCLRPNQWVRSLCFLSVGDKCAFCIGIHSNQQTNMRRRKLLGSRMLWTDIFIHSYFKSH